MQDLLRDPVLREFWQDTTHRRRRHRIMKPKTFVSVISAAAFTGVFFSAVPVLATQTHGQPEGLYVHQFGHLFFIFSLGVLEFWLRNRNLTKEPGWLYIQFAAVLLLLWNVDAFLVHFLGEQTALLHIEKIDPWHIKITSAGGWTSIAVLYYIGKLDHLLCVPAMFCLLLGLKRLAKDTAKANPGTGSP